MRLYPIFLNLEGKRCVVVGGGRVAERKVRGLLRASAVVRVISPSTTPRLAGLADRKKIKLTRRAYRRGDLRAAPGPKTSGRAPLLVFAATNHPATQQAIRDDAAAAGALVNLADDAGRSSFLVPASLSRGNLHVAISTSGASPALARLLRRQLQRGLGRQYRTSVALLRAARKQAMKTIPDQKQRARLFRRLASTLGGVSSGGRRRVRRPVGKSARRIAGRQ